MDFSTLLSTIALVFTETMSYLRLSIFQKEDIHVQHEVAEYRNINYLLFLFVKHVDNQHLMLRCVFTSHSTRDYGAAELIIKNIEILR